MPEASSTLEISLKGGYFGESTFARFMAQIPNLQEFRGECSSWTPCQTVNVLLRYASHSLVSLTLTQPFIGLSVGRKKPFPSYHGVCVGSLRDFYVLTSIRIDVPMLVENYRTLLDEDGDCVSSNEDEAREEDDENSDEDEEELSSTWYIDIAEERQIVHRLIDVLPSSAQSLTLEMLASSAIMQQMLHRVPERKADRLPNLREIFYECEERCTIGIEEECERVGLSVVQVLKYGDFKNFRRDSLDSENSNDRMVERDDWADCEDPGSWYDYHGYSIFEAQQALYWEGILEDEDAAHDTEYTQLYRDIKDFEWLTSQADVAAHDCADTQVHRDVEDFEWLVSQAESLRN